MRVIWFVAVLRSGRFGRCAFLADDGTECIVDFRKYSVAK